METNTDFSHDNFKGVTVQVNRIVDDGKQTFGALHIDGKYFCDTLEHTYRSVKIPENTRIPAGVYPLDYYRKLSPLTEQYRKNFEWFSYHLQLQDVPDFTGIYILLGNEIKGTGGSILVGERSRNNLTNALETYSRLYEYLRNELDHSVPIRIIVRDESTPQHIDDLYETKVKNSQVEEKRSYYVAGSIWGKEEQMERFLDQGNWENGHGKKFTNTTNAVKPDDVIFLKSSFRTGRVSNLRIKAAGIVIANPKDGNNLTVDWKMPYINIPDIPRLGKFAGTIHQVKKEEDLEIIINTIGKDKLGEAGLLEIEKPETQELDETDKIPFHLDQVVDIDLLGREPIAKQMARVVNQEIFKKELVFQKKDPVNYAFMIHLQGSWGEGKSTFMGLFEKWLKNNGQYQNEKENANKWIVVKYNAWQNQHIDPPWWSFQNEIYNQACDTINWRQSLWLRTSEFFRRLTRYKLGSKLIFIGLITLFSFGAIYYGDHIMSLLTNEKTMIQGAKEAVIKTPQQTQNYFKLLVTFGSLIGLFYSFIRFIGHPFMVDSPDEAKQFQQRVGDPMKKVKKNFDSLTSTIMGFKYRVAVFIDDLDRCNDEYVVGLLEGIQTLYKDKPILYLVAGDRHWIAQCFENHYANYTGITQSPGQKLGYLFLEKAFQLSIRLPKMSEKAKDKYWTHILNPDPEPDSQNNEVNQLKRNELKQKLTIKDLTDDDAIDSVMREGFDESEAIDLILDMINEEQEDVKHVLAEHTDLIGTNPRTIKRLANQYSMYRNIMIAERKGLKDKNKLFKWLMLVNNYPVYTDWIEQNLDKFPDQFDEGQFEGLTEDKLWLSLAKADEDALEPKDISLFTGININQAHK